MKHQNNCELDESRVSFREKLLAHGGKEMTKVLLKIAQEFFRFLRNPVFTELLLEYFPPQKCSLAERILVPVLVLTETAIKLGGFYLIIAVLA
ncbi:MAG: hypothetical protein OET79_05325 [Nitrospirota bacterium]|nr:hypothetical protein [Nitrospirota bacterium]